MAKDNASSGLSSSSLEGDELIKKIQETNAPGLDEDDVKPLLQTVEDIMTQASPLSAKIPYLGANGEVNSDDKAVAQIAKMLESPINYTSYVMTWKCVGEVDSHAVTMQILESLSNYWWGSKAVIAYAAFAINYGEFSLLTQSSDKTIATLMGLADQSSIQSDHSKAVLNLLASALKLTRCMVDFKGIPPKYITLQPHEVPLSVYLIIRTLVVCASFLTDVLSDHAITGEGIKMLSTLESRLSPVLQKFQDQVAYFRNLQKVEGKYIEFQNIIGTPSPDNMKVLSAFFRPREDQMPLYHGLRKKNERLEVLKHKHVLLLISDPELPREELNVIHAINSNLSTEHQCEILWLPIVDPNIPMNVPQEAIFRQLRDSFPWFSAEHPSVIEPAAIKFIQEDLNFVHLPLVAVLDAQGKLVNRDAIPMMYIWGIRAFPFSSTEESKLWGESAWNIELLADHIDPRLQAWINGNKVICLYGGDNIDWIRKFTQAARTAAEALHVPLEMFYVGRHNLKEEVRTCHETIIKDNLSHTFNSINYYDFVWFFWARLSSMWNSKKKLRCSVDGDKVMQGIVQLLTYDTSDPGGCWAAFSRGNDEMRIAQGDKLLPTLESYTTWANEVDQPDKFVEVFYQNLVKPPSHCTRLILPGAENIPDVCCSECGKPMEKYIMYRCWPPDE